MAIALEILRYGGSNLMDEKYENLSLAQRDEFRRIANKLLSNCFLCKKKEDTKKDYYFVENHKAVFINYFKYIGWELEINETYGVAHLINTYNSNRYQLKLYESIILLILRILYYEKMQEISLADNVCVDVASIQDRFMALKIREKLIDKGTLKTTLRLFKRFNLIEILDSDLTREDCRILIYPSILLAVRVEDIKKVYEKLDTYKRGGEDLEEANED